jgi:hypothetical protein
MLTVTFICKELDKMYCRKTLQNLLYEDGSEYALRDQTIM